MQLLILIIVPVSGHEVYFRSMEKWKTKEPAANTEHRFLPLLSLHICPNNTHEKRLFYKFSIGQNHA